MTDFLVLCNVSYKFIIIVLFVYCLPSEKVYIEIKILNNYAATK